MSDAFGSFPQHIQAGILSPEELAKIRDAVYEEVLEEIRAKAVKLAREDELHKARVAAGLASADEIEPLIKMTMNLPESVAPVGALVIDGEAYYDGGEYTFKRKQAIYVYHMMAQAWVNQHRTEGRWIDTRRPRSTHIIGEGDRARVVNGPLEMRL